MGEGRDVVFLSRQLDHASSAITLSTYAHLFDHQRYADAARAALGARYGPLLGSSMEATGGNERELAHLPEAREAAP